jgi:hypothetical protein
MRETIDCLSNVVRRDSNSENTPTLGRFAWFSTETLAEAKCVSSEQIQAKLSEFLQVPCIGPDYEESTLESVQVVERLLLLGRTQATRGLGAGELRTFVKGEAVRKPSSFR